MQKVKTCCTDWTEQHQQNRVSKFWDSYRSIKLQNKQRNLLIKYISSFIRTNYIVFLKGFLFVRFQNRRWSHIWAKNKNLTEPDDSNELQTAAPNKRKHNLLTRILQVSLNDKEPLQCRRKGKLSDGGRSLSYSLISSLLMRQRGPELSLCKKLVNLPI